MIRRVARLGLPAALLPLLAALAGVGCRTIPALPPLAPDDPRPAAWLAVLAETEAARHGLRARARVRLAGENASHFARELVLLERPARLRVEVLGLMGQRVALLATDGEQYDLYRAEAGRVETGAMHAGILAEVADLPLGPEEAVTLLLGVPSLAPGYDAGEALPDGGVRLHWLGQVRGSADLDAEGRLRAASYTLAGDPRPLLEAHWDDYRALGDGLFAHRVVLDFPTRKARVEVEFSDVELDPQLDPTLFRLSSPAGEVR